MSEDVTDQVTRYLRDQFEVEPQRASVTFLGVEPIDVLRFVVGDDMTFITVGCARHPMTDPTQIELDPVAGPRAELVVRLHGGSPTLGLHRRMATLAAAPSVEGLILGVDSLLDLGEPLFDGAPFTALLTEADDLGELALPAPLDPVRFLRAVPITANEAAWVRLKGASALREAWVEAGIDIADPRRAAASL